MAKREKENQAQQNKTVTENITVKKQDDKKAEQQSNPDREQKKELQKYQRQLEKLEQQINELNKKKSEIEMQMSDPATYASQDKFKQLYQRLFQRIGYPAQYYFSRI